MRSLAPATRCCSAIRGRVVGKVDKFGLVALANELGVETVMLDHGLDLEQLARDAVARGADCLGMAGGDGSQALVASIAVECGLPFVCVTAGTRNHFALDLGLDRDDPRKSVYAFRDAIERRIDYAVVNDRFFVNNVSLGVYATIVQQDSYRDAKAETTKTLLPELLGNTDEPFDLQFDTPDGTAVDGAFLIQVSNNPYVLGASLDITQRRRMDTGKLGVIALSGASGKDAAAVAALAAIGQRNKSRNWHEFTAERFEVRSRSGSAFAGVDGEALDMPTPLVFTIHPGGLRLLVPREISKLPSNAALATSASASYSRRKGIAMTVRTPQEISQQRDTPEERAEQGRSARSSVPRSSHRFWEEPDDRADPVTLLEEQNAERVPWLVPLRHGRMSVSPFTFYRGAARIMASDLASTPNSGLSVQLGGDAHLSNFGAFASPERQLMFDANDFDETLPGPFEWDLKRLAASFTVAADHLGFRRADRRRATARCVESYRTSMVRYAGMGYLERWYEHLTASDRRGRQRDDPGRRPTRPIRAQGAIEDQPASARQTRDRGEWEVSHSKPSACAVPVARAASGVRRAGDGSRGPYRVRDVQGHARR